MKSCFQVGNKKAPPVESRFQEGLSGEVFDSSWAQEAPPVKAWFQVGPKKAWSGEVTLSSRAQEGFVR